MGVTERTINPNTSAKPNTKTHTKKRDNETTVAKMAI